MLYFVSIVPWTAPVSSKIYSDFFRDYTGGGVGNGNAKILLYPIDLISKTTLYNGNRQISGSGCSSIILAYKAEEYNL